MKADINNRISYAIKQFEAMDIEYQLKNSTTGHFHCYRKADDKLIQFYAGTGTIIIDNQKQSVTGIHAAIKILCKEM